jgi:hypothetical protein
MTDQTASRTATPTELDELLALPADQRPAHVRRLFRAGVLVPVMGADDADPPPAKDDPPKEDPAPKEDPPKTEWTPPTKEEWDAQQKAIAAANRKVRDQERNQSKAEEERAKKAGEYEELYGKTNTELERVKGLVAKSAVKDAVTEAARKLRFRNPALASKLIDLDGVDATLDLSGDEPKAEVEQVARNLIETRLKAAAEADPYLLGDPHQRQLPGAGGNDGNEGGGGGGDAAGNASMNQAIRRAAGRS